MATGRRNTLQGAQIVRFQPSAFPRAPLVHETGSGLFARAWDRAAAGIDKVADIAAGEAIQLARDEFQERVNRRSLEEQDAAQRLYLDHEYNPTGLANALQERADATGNEIGNDLERAAYQDTATRLRNAAVLKAEANVRDRGAQELRSNFLDLVEKLDREAGIARIEGRHADADSALGEIREKIGYAKRSTHFPPEVVAKLERNLKDSAENNAMVSQMLVEMRIPGGFDFAKGETFIDDVLRGKKFKGKFDDPRRREVGGILRAYLETQKGDAEGNRQATTKLLNLRRDEMISQVTGKTVLIDPYENTLHQLNITGSLAGIDPLGELQQRYDAQNYMRDALPRLLVLPPSERDAEFQKTQSGPASFYSKEQAAIYEGYRGWSAGSIDDLVKLGPYAPRTEFIDFGNTSPFIAQQLASRATMAPQLRALAQRTGHTNPRGFDLLSKQEKVELEQRIKDADGGERLQMMAAIIQGTQLDPIMGAQVGDIFGKAAPGLQVAASIIDSNPIHARRITEGMDKLKDLKGAQLPTSLENKELLSLYSEVYGEALGGDRAIATEHIEAAKAAYVAEMVPGEVFDEDRFKQMLEANVGGIYSWSGNKMVAPEVNGRTVPEGDVRRLREKFRFGGWDEYIKRKQARGESVPLMTDGNPVPQEAWNDSRLVYFGGDQYIPMLYDGQKGAYVPPIDSLTGRQWLFPYGDVEKTLRDFTSASDVIPIGGE